MGSRKRREKDYKQGRSDRSSKGMVLFPGFCFGSYQACLHGKRTGSNHSLCILKGYKLNARAIIENSIMKYHKGNKRGLIPHPATITRLCIRAGVKGTWEEEEECPKISLLNGGKQGAKKSKEKGGHSGSRF